MVAVSTASVRLWISDPQAYREKMFKFLGDREPLEVLAQTPDRLSETVSMRSVTELRSRPFAQKWTPNEVIGHLGDSEWVYGYRLRLIFSEDDPAILGVDQDLWVTAQRHNDREPSELVGAFQRLRKLNLDVWGSVSPRDLQRSGHHNVRGAESLAVMLRMWAGHDLSHLSQITGYLKAIRGMA